MKDLGVLVVAGYYFDAKITEVEAKVSDDQPIPLGAWTFFPSGALPGYELRPRTTVGLRVGMMACLPLVILVVARGRL